MSFQRRLSLATRGYRGTFTENVYVNEEFFIKEDFEIVDINFTTPLTVLEDVSVTVDSVLDIGFDVITEHIGVDVSIEELQTDIDNC